MIMDVWGSARVRILARRYNLNIELWVNNIIDQFDTGPQTIRTVRASNVIVKVTGAGVYAFLKFEPATQETNLPEEVLKAIEALGFSLQIDDEQLYLEAKG